MIYSDEYKDYTIEWYCKNFRRSGIIRSFKYDNDGFDNLIEVIGSVNYEYLDIRRHISYEDFIIEGREENINKILNDRRI
tara:strand:- start:265 stop:504 length:240 start_codon:yes stop_codon:yes gene_type:complete